MVRRRLHILLVNPWIHDFAAYDFWARPLGLLYVGSVLRDAGCTLSLVDCMDRRHPAVAVAVGPLRERGDGTGKFFRQPIAKPAVVRHVPRVFCRCGMPVQVFARQLRGLARPNAILVTSGMTYWYTGLAETVSILREAFPGVPVVVGGIYASLCPEHAQQTLAPEALVQGPGENAVVQVVNRLCAAELPEARYGGLDELPYPAYDLYPELEAVAVLTSRGCPYRCSFCASALLTEGFAQRMPEAVVDEIAHWVGRGARHIAFYDDALFLRADEHIKPLLELVLRRGVKAQFHTPNGVQPRAVDRELARLLRQAGFATLRLSFETVNEARQKDMSGKVSGEDLARALDALAQAGFRRRDIGVYLLMGLPGQKAEEVVESILFVARLGARVCLACFSPIPGTPEWQRAVTSGALAPEVDPLLCNESVYPLSGDQRDYWSFVRLRNLATAVNRVVAAGGSIIALPAKEAILHEIVRPRLRSMEAFFRSRFSAGATPCLQGEVAQRPCGTTGEERKKCAPIGQ
ncbi:MAG: radical SAM protein [bacterium]|jgi:pyruvate-formate lyase-activating enzyme|nr:B12-binding domain-containing radical SAM protein [candidate division KSB1 bacterium]MDH7560531.1 radical SAM protein [bacterium]